MPLRSLFYVWLTVGVFFISIYARAQSPKIDSLTQALVSLKNDTNRVNCLQNLALQFLFHDLEKSKEFSRRTTAAAKKIKFKKGEGYGYYLNGVAHKRQGNNDSAIFYYEKAITCFKKGHEPLAYMRALLELAVAEKSNGNFDRCYDCYKKMQATAKRYNDTLFMVEALNGFANVYRYKDDYAASLKYYLKTVALSEKAGMKKQEATALANMAIVYNYLNKFENEITSLEKATQILGETHDTLRWITSCGLLGYAYLETGNPAAAEKWFDRAEEIARGYGFERAGPFTVAEIHSHLGALHENTGNLEESRKEHEKSHAWMIRTGDIKNIASSWGTLANIHIKIGNWEKAIECSSQQLRLTAEINYKRGQLIAHGTIAEAYKNLGNYKQALEHYEKYTALRDTLLNEANLEQINLLQEEFETEKKEQQIQALQKEKIIESKLSETDHRRKNAILAAVLVGLTLVALLLWQTFRSLRVSRMQKKVIEQKQTDIIDSITYAKRLQQAILATPEEIREHVKDFFLLYRPKDIVAGDFYFFETTDTHIFIAAADCTGHGVPGALVSMVCSNALTRCVREFGLTDPGKILDKTSELVTQTFEKSGENVKDGMDISFCSISFQAPASRFEDENNLKLDSVKPETVPTLRWAGAYNSLWYTSNGTMTQVAGTKKHVGKSEDLSNFKTHTLSLPSNSMVFLLTDGFADQFGGRDGKKFKTSNLTAFLAAGAHLATTEQQTRLENCFNEWKGDLEQVDDVCIIGMRV